MEGPEIWPRASKSYRTCVATVSVFAIIQCGKLAYKVLRESGVKGMGFSHGSRGQSGRTLNYHRSTRWTYSKQATLAQAILAVLCGVAALTGAVLATLDRRTVYVMVSFLTAASRWVDGMFSWQRYRLVHQDFQPTPRQTALVRSFVFIGLCLPYLTSVGFWALTAYGAPIRHKLAYRVIANSMGAFDLLIFPANIIWDSSLGCKFIARIRQLTESIRSDEGDALSQNQILLSLARNTLVYICISFVANSALLLAYIKVIPGLALVSVVFHLTFAFLTHYLFNSKATTVTFAFVSDMIAYYSSFFPVRRRSPAEPGGGSGHSNDSSWVTDSAAEPTAEGTLHRSPLSPGSGGISGIPDESTERSEGDLARAIELRGTPKSSPRRRVRQSPAQDGPLGGSSPMAATALFVGPSPGGAQAANAGRDRFPVAPAPAPARRPPLRFFAQYVLSRGRVRGLFRVSEEDDLQLRQLATPANSSTGAPRAGNAVPGGGGGGGGGKPNSNATGRSSAGGTRRNPSVATSKATRSAGGGTSSSSIVSTPDAIEREVILDYDQAFSPPRVADAPLSS